MIYFIRAGEGDAVKIGKANCVAKRLAGLQVGHSEKLVVIRMMEGGLSEERWLHQHYANRRLKGEWFQYCETMLTIEVPAFTQNKVRERRQEIKDSLLDAFRRSAPPGKVTAAEIAAKVGVSEATIDSWRNRLPNGFAQLIEYGRAYPSFGREFMKIVFEGMDAEELKAALIKRLDDGIVRKVWKRPEVATLAAVPDAPELLSLKPREAFAHGRTHKQNALLKFLRSYTAENDGVSPAFGEMADAIGLKSKSGVHRLLTSLEERGAIRRIKNRARSIEVLA